MDMGIDTGLLILRLAVGFTFFYHGTQKLFGWFGGYGLEKTAGFMESMGFFPGKRNAFLAGLTEGLGGLLLFLGLLTPIASIMTLSVMIVAAGAAHIKNGFNISKGGFEYNLILGLAGLCMAFTGPGHFSIDAVMGKNYSGIIFGIGALLIGTLGAGAQLAMRKAPVKQT